MITGRNREVGGVGLILGLAVVLVWAAGCASKAAPERRMPLSAPPGMPPSVVTLTEQGSQEFRRGHYIQAKQLFERAVAGAPMSGEAHYNLGLALYELGERALARRHFMDAADLAPGHKVIWNSPALAPHGEPEPTLVEQPKDQQSPVPRSGFGGSSLGY